MTSAGLLTVSFLVPPTGVIDPSVLTGVGELFGFATLASIPKLIKGRSVELKHGKTTLNLGDDDGDNASPDAYAPGTDAESEQTT